MTRQSLNCLAIVLAAGEGTRMKSDRPKVMHEIAGRPMLGHVLAAVAASGAGSRAVVVGPGHDAAAALAREAGAEVFVQAERRGTAHAVLAAREALAAAPDVVVVAFGDTPLVSPATFGRLIAAIRDGAAVAALGFTAEDPTGYGRLVEAGGELVAIREHRDASEEERAIRLCNAGLMALDGRRALALLEGIGSTNSQGEFYLTDVVEVARRQGLKAVALVTDEAEVQGVNDRVQLARAEATLQARLREAAMRGGATLIAPETVFFSHDTVLGRDVLVEPHVVFGPAVIVGDGATIHAFSHLAGAVVESGASVGPYGRLRPGAVLRSGAKVGNFVEVKNAEIGPGAKLPHLSYVGDASVGPKANVGAGTITCNYDGFNKSRTVIGEGAFVGSNSSLVAPVTIGAGAMVGSGSVITDDVPDDALALGRGRQAIKPGWAAAFRARPENQKKKK